MGKCIKCGTKFIGTAANPPKDGVCHYCERDDLKAKLRSLHEEVIGACPVDYCITYTGHLGQYVKSNFDAMRAEIERLKKIEAAAKAFVEAHREDYEAVKDSTSPANEPEFLLLCEAVLTPEEAPEWVLRSELEREQRYRKQAGEQIVKLRTALNQIAHPDTFKSDESNPRKIALKALIIQ